MTPELVNHQSITRGGAMGHWMRRAIHISTLIIPFLYYAYGHQLASALGFPLSVILVVIFAIIVLFEALRIAIGFRALGQREYETKRISAFAWGAIAIVIVLLFAPGKGFGIAIIASCALVDPLLGELRQRHVYPLIVILLGMIAVFFIWWHTAVLWLIPVWWSVIMAPVIIAAEWPRLTWIDDNALMQLAPLVLVLLIHWLLLL